jgi:hypothetical protein
MIHLITKNKLLTRNIILNISRGFKREVVSTDFDVNHRPKLKQKEKLDLNKEYVESLIGSTEIYTVENKKWCIEIDNLNDRED